ncbi:MAG: oligosaccharide flippase family protein, partial [Terriglobales bacterium]
MPTSKAEAAADASRASSALDTEHLKRNLRAKSVRGGAVTLTAQAMKYVLQVVSTIVLARLLTPRDFGLVAMVTALTGVVSMFAEAGLSDATVQREEINHAQLN